MHFVHVLEDDPAGLGVDGKPWRCIGVNCYYLLTRGAEARFRPGILSLLDHVAGSGLNTIRAWAFNDGAGQWNAIQRAPGVYDERMLCALDWVVQHCKQRGLRLLLALTNYWHDYGGIRQYAKWSSRTPDKSCVVAESFYTDPEAQALYLQYVRMLLARTNTLTGVRYDSEPAIMGWEVINEPRCERGSGVDPGAMYAWLAVAVRQVKQLAGQQLVTIGSEGFWGPSTPEQLHVNPYNPQPHGCDWGLEVTLPGLDFTCIHLYPDHWFPGGASPDKVVAFTRQWIQAHADFSRRVGKPLLLTEFGSRMVNCVPLEQQAVVAPRCLCGPEPAGLGALDKEESQLAATESQGGSGSAGTQQLLRHHYFSHILEACFGAPSELGGRGQSPPVAGALVWTAAGPEYPDYDGFSMYCPDAVQMYRQQLKDSGAAYVCEANDAAVEARTLVAFQEGLSWHVMAQWAEPQAQLQQRQ